MTQQPFDPNDPTDIRQFSNGISSHPCHRLQWTHTNANAEVELETNRFGKLVIGACSCRAMFIRQLATEAEINVENIRVAEPELFTRMGKAWDQMVDSVPKDAKLFVPLGQISVKDFLKVLGIDLPDGETEQ